MPPRRTGLPGFKASCTAVGALYVVLAGMTIAQGPRAVLQPFGLPEQVLASAHFADFFHFLFVHMCVLGLLIALLGRYVEDARSQRLIARVLCLVELHYLYLDLRTSVWGNGLYAHPKSLVPVFIDALVLLCFAILSMKRLPPGALSPAAPSSD
jgi:hypothetical protein